MSHASILTVLSVLLLCFVSLVKGKETIHCTFNNGPCEWKEVNGHNCWLISPPQENLAGMKSYLYFNTSCPIAEIQTKPMSGFFSKSEEEFHFWYYMHGEGDGDLLIIDHDFFGPIFGNKPHVAFHCKGDHGHQWHHAHVRIPGGATFMGIIAKTTGTFLIAIDNITADSHGVRLPSEQTCPPRQTTLKKTTPALTTESLKTTENIQSTAAAELHLTSDRPAKAKGETSDRPAKAEGETTTTTPSAKKAEYTTNAESTIRKKRRPSLITKSIQPVESTTQDDSIETSREDKSKKDSSIDHIISLREERQAASLVQKSTIIGGCIGGIALLVCTLVTVYFVYRRVRFSSMYSFRRRKLTDEQEIISN